LTQLSSTWPRQGPIKESYLNNHKKKEENRISGRCHLTGGGGGDGTSTDRGLDETLSQRCLCREGGPRSSRTGKKKSTPTKGGEVRAAPRHQGSFPPTERIIEEGESMPKTPKRGGGKKGNRNTLYHAKATHLVELVICTLLLAMPELAIRSERR